jgi:pimeloyl-ACP methyl ester carboxylesterase
MLPLGYAEQDGVSLAWTSLGGGEPIVFAHEFAQRVEGWASLWEQLAPHWRCVGYNARGYPPSGRPADGRYSVELAAGDLFAVMDAAGVRSAHLVGASMGAATVLEAALSRPDRVRSACLVGFGNGLTEQDHPRFLMYCEELAAAFERGDACDIVARFQSAPSRQRQRCLDGWPEFLEQVVSIPDAAAAATLRLVMGRRPTLAALRPRLAGLRTPLLFICGDEDGQCQLAAAEMKTSVAHACFATVAGSGHSPYLERPQAFAQAYQGFLAKQRRTASP